MSNPISTPCVAVCTLDAAGRICTGCGRTIEEIGAWSSMSENARRAVMARLTLAPKQEVAR